MTRWVLSVCVVMVVLPADIQAEGADAAEFLKLMKLSQSEIEGAKAGKIVTGTTDASNERELVATMSFVANGVTPDVIVQKGKAGLLDRVDDQTISFAILSADPTIEDFAKLDLKDEDVRDFSRAKAGDTLNLSAAEIAAFSSLGKKASAEKVESAVRKMMLERVQAYRAKGFAGIAPYQRSSNSVRSAADDLKSAVEASRGLEKVAPTAYEYLLDYPKGKPEGAEEVYRWEYIEAHDEPTVVLTHSLYIPEGEGWIILQRQFYVSRGYNCEQALAAVMPYEKGTVVFYVNRTSTDQVSGFGGGAKRSIGSKLLSSQLEELYSEAREAASK